MNNNLVSVIMPNYNCAKYITEAIESVISQTYECWELIIVDDCSQDNSVDLINNYVKKDKRIRLIQNKKNSGAAVSRNVGIESAKGRWIALLDSDDLWMPEKLEKQISFMEKNEVYFSFSGCVVIDEESTESQIVFMPSKKVYTYKNILEQNDINASTAVYDSLKLGKYYMPELAIKREDYACFLELLKVCDGYSIQEVLMKYRVHNSVSSNKLKMIRHMWNVYFRVEKIGFTKSIYYMIRWALHGLKKYTGV